MKPYDRITSSPLWLTLPAVVLVCALGVVVGSYEPLLFDPSLYTQAEALAAEPAAEAQLEAEKSQDEKPKQATLSADTDAAADGKLTDGTWTGYAVCGEGNPHGWNPYYVAVTIEVKDGKVARIASIKGSATGDEGATQLSWDASESQGYLDLAADGRAGDGVRAQMDAQLAADGRVGSVDAVSGATYSSSAIYAAYANAVAKAGGTAAATAAPVAASAPVATQDTTTSKPASTSLQTTSGTEYKNGTWTGYAICGSGNSGGWMPYYVAVTVQVSGGKVRRITDVRGSATGDSGDPRLSWDASESQRFLTWAASGRNGSAGVQTQINSQLSASGSVSSVDTVSGATYSSDAIANAYAAALRKAAKTSSGTSQSTGVKTQKKPSPDDPIVPVDEDEPVTPTGPGSGSGGDSGQEGGDEELQDKRLADGTWTGCAVCGTGNDDLWDRYYVSLTVTVADGKVTSITDAHGQATGEEGDARLTWNASESQRYLDWAAQGRTRSGKTYVGVLEQMRNAVATSGSTLGDIDVVSGATFSSNALVKAYYVALRKSAAAGGVEIQEPGDDDPTGPGQGDDPTDPGSGDDPADPTDPADPGQGDDPADPGQGDDPTDPGSGDDPTDPTDPGDDEPTTTGLVDGTYVGHGWCEDPDYEDDWDPYYVLVTIVVNDGVVSAVSGIEGDTDGVVDPNVRFDPYNATYLNLAINGNTRVKGLLSKLPAELDDDGKVVGVDTISGATFSSKAILEGYAHAVSQARA